MTRLLRCGLACVVLLAMSYLLAPSGVAQDKEYAIKVMPPGGPAPRLADGHPDLSGHWLPNSAGQGLGGRFAVDPAARAQFDPKVTPEEPPALQPWAAAKIKSMTATEIEEYALHVIAMDYSGEGGGGEVCCWTAAIVRVSVTR